MAAAKENKREEARRGQGKCHNTNRREVDTEARAKTLTSRNPLLGNSFPKSGKKKKNQKSTQD